MWICFSSLPQNKYRPDTDNPHDVKPGLPFGTEYDAISWSERISYILAVLSSEAVAKLWPFGWYYKMTHLNI